MSSKISSMSQFLKKYFLSFYVFGFYKCPIGDPSRPFTKLLTYFPKLIHIMFIIWSIYLFWRDLIEDKLSIIYFTLGTAPIPNIVFVLDTDFHAKKLDALFADLFHTENYLHMLMNDANRIKIFQRRIRMHFFINVLIITMFFIKIWIYSETIIMHAVYRFVLMIYKFSEIFLIIIVIEYRNFLIFSLNETICILLSKRSNAYVDICNLVHHLRHIRILHFNLHKISAMISSRFGWCLVIIFLDNFNLITSFFCAIAMTPGSYQRFEIIRKYFIDFVQIYFTCTHLKFVVFWLNFAQIIRNT